MSIVPKASSVFATKFLTDSALEISHSMNRAFLPAASAASLPDLLISLKTTLAPSLIKSWAIPKPIPEAAPVTIATLVANLDIRHLIAF
jgi:hypothetical protein